MENKEEKKLLTVKDLCAYLSIGETKARESCCIILIMVLLFE